MKAAGQDANSIFEYLVNEAMFFIDSTRPAALQIVPQWLRFSGAPKGIALQFFDEFNDS